MVFNTGNSKVVIDLDSCEGVYIKKNGEECKLEDYIYKLVLLALIREREESAELKKAEMATNFKTAKDIMRLFGFEFEENNES